MARVSLKGSNREERLDLVFHALASSTRRALLEQLRAGPASITELAEGHDMSLPAISKHLLVLEQASLVKRTQEGRVHRCVLMAGALREAEDWVAAHRAFWQNQLHRLAAHIARDTSMKATRRKKQ